MSDEKKGVLEILWKMKDLSVAEFIEEIKANSDLKFLLGSVGAWYISKKIVQLIVFLNLIYFLYHMVLMVLG